MYRIVIHSDDDIDVSRAHIVNNRPRGAGLLDVCKQLHRRCRIKLTLQVGQTVREDVVAPTVSIDFCDAAQVVRRQVPGIVIVELK